MTRCQEIVTLDMLMHVCICLVLTQVVERSSLCSLPEFLFVFQPSTGLLISLWEVLEQRKEAFCGSLELQCNPRPYQRAAASDNGKYICSWTRCKPFHVHYQHTLVLLHSIFSQGNLLYVYWPGSIFLSYFIHLKYIIKQWASECNV